MWEVCQPALFWNSNQTLHNLCANLTAEPCTFKTNTRGVSRASQFESLRQWPSCFICFWVRTSWTRKGFWKLWGLRRSLKNFLCWGNWMYLNYTGWFRKKKMDEKLKNDKNQKIFMVSQNNEMSWFQTAHISLSTSLYLLILFQNSKLWDTK